jgi:ribonuclease HII
MSIVGIDEVGRGCWAGPLVVGAVILNEPITGLKDSKLLSKIKRQSLDKEIRLKADYFSLGWVESSEIDEIGLTKATTLAINRAIENLGVDYDQIIIDGNINFLPNNIKASCLIKADSLVPAVSAASIIAKVARDKFMNNISNEYPGYGFDKHVGYGTAIHKQALIDFGPTKLHRKSFSPIKLSLNGTAQ